MSIKSGTPKLNEALAKAQLVMTAAKRDAVNPHFKSTYADLASIIEACRKPLAENGLAVAQVVSTDAKGVTVTTRLLHISGESMEGACWMPVAQQTPQAFGSAITYGRRYALAAMVGVAAEDDDGNASSAAGKVPLPAGVEKLRQQIAKPAAPNEPPPHTDDDAPPAGQTGAIFPPDAKAPNYGKGNGMMLSQIDVDSLRYYEGGCLKTLADPAKAKFHEKEQRTLASVREWIAFRS